jgi:hypothetical protein
MMHRLANWLRSGRAESKLVPAPTSEEWQALEKALAEHDFASLLPRLRAWCMLAERDTGVLEETARRNGFSDIDLNKIGIMFAYYSGDVQSAFDRGQIHLQSHGFDQDLHLMSLASLYQGSQFEVAHAYLQRLGTAELAQMLRADYWHLVAAICWANNDMARLEQAIDRALELAADDGALLETALGMYIELGAQEKVQTVRARLAQSTHAGGFTHSLSLLALGEKEQGWRLMEGRFDVDETHLYINPGLRSYPRWKGEPLSGKRLLVSTEQGLGDTIQMARYLDLLQSLGPGKIVMEAQLETLPLLQYNFPSIPVVESRWGQAPPLEFDLWIGMMSLPFLLKAWKNNAPGRDGYLRVPPENARYWEERIGRAVAGQRPKVGLAWSGQPRHRSDRRRSIPFELMMRYVRGLPVSFFALQTYVPQVLPANVINVSEEMITLADTAALIEQMDMVITVDTSVVHIAGALGKETWLLLPKRYEWRWGLEGEQNDWYDSVKVIRQTEHANWAAVLQDVFEHRLPEQFNL